jgi:hypothetical protein
MECTLKINVELLSHGESVTYKYVIHAPNIKSQKYDPYEFLHHGKGKDEVLYRVLKLTNDIKSKSRIVNPS